jgi:hypothetical protein
MNFMDIHRAGPLAFRASAAPDFLKLFFQQFGRDLLRDAQNIGVLMATVVAKTGASRLHPSHDDCGTAISAFGHICPRFLLNLASAKQLSPE